MIKDLEDRLKDALNKGDRQDRKRLKTGFHNVDILYCFTCGVDTIHNDKGHCVVCGSNK